VGHPKWLAYCRQQERVRIAFKQGKGEGGGQVGGTTCTSGNHSCRARTDGARDRRQGGKSPSRTRKKRGEKKVRLTRLPGWTPKTVQGLHQIHGKLKRRVSRGGLDPRRGAKEKEGTGAGNWCLSPLKRVQKTPTNTPVVDEKMHIQRKSRWAKTLGWGTKTDT